MEAHSSSSRLFARLRHAWKRVFFWQAVPVASKEHAPPPSPDQALVAKVTASTPLPRWQQLRYLSHVFSRKERFQFWTSLVAGLTFLLIAAGFFLEPRLVRQPSQGGMLVEGLVGAPKWVNPVLALSTVDRDLSQLVFSGLFVFDGGVLRPDLAASTQVLDQGTVLEIRLREDARFHDGQPLTADDVVFTLNDAIRNPSWHSPLAERFANIEAIRIDPYTVQIKMTGTPLNQAALQTLLTVGILPGHRWEDANEGSPQLAEDNLKPIGSGPYQFEAFTRDTRGAILTYTLKRFSGYYGQSPLLDQRQFRFYPDRKSAELALQSRQLDALAFVPWSEQEQVRGTGQKALQLELPQVTTIFFNTQDALLKERSLRTALQLAIDRGELSQQIPHVTPLQTPFPYLETYSTSTQLTNLDKARQLLEEARWKLDEATGQRFLQPAPTARPTRGTASSTSATFATSTPLRLSLLVPTQGDLPIVAESLKRRWSLLGADVTVEALEREEIMRRALDERTHQIVLLNVLAQDDADLLPFWKTDEDALNFSQWTSATVTNGLQSLATATSSDVIARERVRVTEAILGQEAAVFLFRPSYAYLLQNGIQGTQNLQIRSPADRLTATLGWYVRTRLRWQGAP